MKNLPTSVPRPKVYPSRGCLPLLPAVILLDGGNWHRPQEGLPEPAAGISPSCYASLLLCSHSSAGCYWGPGVLRIWAVEP